MKRKETYEAAENLTYGTDLQVIEITRAYNSYPQELHAAIIGFETFDEAEAFAKEHGMDVHKFSTTEGWQFWHDQGWIDGPMDMSNYLEDDIFDRVDYGDDVMLLEAIKNQVNEHVGNPNADEIEAVLKSAIELVSEYKSLDENEFLYLSGSGGCWRTAKSKCMSYSYDTHKYAIGCAFDVED